MKECSSSTIPTRDINQGNLHHVQCSSTMTSVMEPRTAAAERGSHFPFDRLPWEIREVIWQACLPEDVFSPRLCFFLGGAVFDPATVSEDSFHRQYISPALLRLAHICYHSRCVAMRHITVWRNAKGQRTLCKRAIPERDCVFLTHIGLRIALRHAEGGEGDGPSVIKSPWARAMRYVAINHDVIELKSDGVFRLLSALPSLRLLLVNFQGPDAQSGYGVRGLRVVHLEKGEQALHKAGTLCGPAVSTMLATRKGIVMAEAIGKPGGPWDPETGELFVEFKPANIWTCRDESIPRVGFSI